MQRIERGIRNDRAWIESWNRQGRQVSKSLVLMKCQQLLQGPNFPPTQKSKSKWGSYNKQIQCNSSHTSTDSYHSGVGEQETTRQKKAAKGKLHLEYSFHYFLKFLLNTHQAHNVVYSCILKDWSSPSQTNMDSPLLGTFFIYSKEFLIICSACISWNSYVPRQTMGA